MQWLTGPSHRLIFSGMTFDVSFLGDRILDLCDSALCRNRKLKEEVLVSRTETCLARCTQSSSLATCDSESSRH